VKRLSMLLLLVLFLVGVPHSAQALAPGMAGRAILAAEAGITQAPLPEETVAPPPRPIAVRFEGTITAIAQQLPGDWVIEGITVTVTVDTVILPASHVPQVGDYALVSALQVGETLVAERIQIRLPDDAAQKIEFRGLINALPTAPWYGDWMVAGVKVQVKAERAIIVGAPSLGYYAYVRGWLKGSVVEAERIEVINPVELTSESEFEGPIQTINDKGDGTWVIAGVRGMVDASTIREGDLVAGAMVRASGQRLADGGFAFKRIRALAPGELEVRLRGLIVEINLEDGYWLIDETFIGAGEPTLVFVDELAFVDESRAKAKPGMEAEVIARRQGRWLLALRIRVEPRD